MVPLQSTPFYAENSVWGLPRDTALWHRHMTELVQSGNALIEPMLRSLINTEVLPGARIGRLGLARPVG